MDERIIIAKKLTQGAPALTSLIDGEQCWNVAEQCMYIRDGANVVVQNSKPFDQMVQNTMRFYSYPDGRWISNGDDNYGLNTENASESAGTGNDPIREWEITGRFLNKGMKIPKYQLKGRCNDITNSPEWEIKIEFRYPNDQRWDDIGLDNDNEMTSVEIYRGFWRTPVSDSMGQLPFTHPINDIHRRVYPLDFTVPEDGYLITFMRPLRLLASVGNDYFYGDEVVYIKY